MKKISFFALFLVLFSSSVFSSPQGEYYSSSYARMSYVMGDVYIDRAGGLGYEEGTVNLVLVEGDKLGTKEGRAEIHFGRKNYLRLDHNTQIDFIKLPKKGDESISLHLLAGSIYLSINFLPQEKNIEVHTPDASFYILEEGLYRFEVKENVATEALVYEGSLEASGEESSLLLEKGERIVTSQGRFISEPEYFSTRLEDSFAEWNNSREKLNPRIVSTHYLPSELEEYEYELASNGHWVYERPYGYVWVPYVDHYVWRPYFYGRWVWYPIIGWNWVSYEPWGWCVYHYGRWHWRFGLGWYWIPTYRWGPAWVYWYWGPEYIGWCPMSYYGYPVVIINNYFYDRYYDRSYPVHSRALTIIRKDQLHDRNISRVAISNERLSHLGKISLSLEQPSLRPQINKLEISNSEGARVLARSRIRKVEKIYQPNSRIESTSPSSFRQRSFTSRLTSRKEAFPENTSYSIRPESSLKSPFSSRVITREKVSSESRKKFEPSRIPSFGSNSSSGSQSTIKIYPRKEYTSSRPQKMSSLSRSFNSEIDVNSNLLKFYESRYEIKKRSSSPSQGEYFSRYLYSSSRAFPSFSRVFSSSDRSLRGSGSFAKGNEYISPFSRSYSSFLPSLRNYSFSSPSRSYSGFQSSTNYFSPFSKGTYSSSRSYVSSSGTSRFSSRPSFSSHSSFSGKIRKK